jgi:hypothetical protein
MNAWNPHPAHPAIHQREQWISEQLYQWIPSLRRIGRPGLRP